MDNEKLYIAGAAIFGLALGYYLATKKATAPVVSQPTQTGVVSYSGWPLSQFSLPDFSKLQLGGLNRMDLGYMPLFGFVAARSS